jgi:orotate phosphoribosyltransferase
MNYRSVADLNDDVKRWVPRLPQGIDLVVGIPRSGLLAGNLVALTLNVPLTDLDGFLDSRVISTGDRFEDELDARPERVLVVDDSVLTGTSMTEARERVAAADIPAETEVVFGAVYVSPRGERNGIVDTYADVVKPPRVFEWNLMHHPGIVPKSCFDLDGVLCRDPTPEENDDGERYREFISTVDPRVVPSNPIGRIVTARLEKYRDQTEAWLDRHGIEYGELIMLDLPSAEERRRRGNHAEYKAEAYRETDAKLFVESDHTQAVEIAQLTDRPVYSVEHNQMIRQGRATELRRESQQRLRRLQTDPVGSLRRTVGSVAVRLGLLSP